jgi:ribonucleotide reductase alpha subunit
LWNKDLKEEIMYNYGSIQNIDCIPQYIKDNFKTVWEIKQKVIIDMAADRGIYIDQSQSMNLFVDNVQFDKLTKMHFYAWKKGLKTGQYYLRTKPSVRAQQFTIDPNKAKSFANAAPMEPEECENCGA